MGVSMCKYRPRKRKIKRPMAKSGCFHTCLTAMLNPGRYNNEAPGRNVLAEALPAHECSRLESRVNSIFLAWAPGFSTHVALLSVTESKHHFSLFTFHFSLFTFHFSLFTFHFSLPCAPCSLLLAFNFYQSRNHIQRTIIMRVIINHQVGFMLEWQDK